MGKSEELRGPKGAQQEETLKDCSGRKMTAFVKNRLALGAALPTVPGQDFEPMFFLIKCKVLADPCTGPGTDPGCACCGCKTTRPCNLG